jgi:putative hydrolase of HD superfamily
MVENNLLDFFQVIGKLKKTKRTGWVREGVPNAESVAEHIYRVTIMSMLLAKKTVNVDKVVRMALVHDIAEAVVGDIVVERGEKTDLKAKEQKDKLEREAMRKLCDSIKRKDLFDTWSEFEDGNSEEAKFVKQMDKLEMALQAYEYETAHGKNLDEFFKSAKSRMSDPELLQLLDVIIKKRK